ncbi:pyrroloquinoline quinone biosynthesis protein C, partial [Neptuniibacter sp. 2_MG-2023]|nr:pyrroloquinoline quinone biosynthesis protein C [Neptuniibacter sp. 2_MG-2023]
KNRLTEARRDVEHGLGITLDHYTTREQQERMLEILQFKLDVLWSMLDAMTMAYELKRPPYHTVTDQRVYHKGLFNE